jgi:hypothetical protein
MAVVLTLTKIETAYYINLRFRLKEVFMYVNVISIFISWLPIMHVR